MKKLITFLMPLFLALTSSQDLDAQTITTIAGGGTISPCDGCPATAAWIRYPYTVAMDDTGNIYTLENCRLRKVSTSGIITTIAGDGTIGYTGDGGPASASKITPNSSGIVFDGSANLYFSGIGSSGCHCIRKINTAGIISTIAGSSSPGFAGDGLPASVALLNYPSGICYDNSGNLYIADKGNARIRMINTLGIVSTIAGNGSLGLCVEGIAATASPMGSPQYIATSYEGDIYFTDGLNHRVYKIGAETGIITKIAGNGPTGISVATCLFSGDGGPATAAVFCQPHGIVLDNLGNIFVADIGNNRIRKINAAGIISTYAGIGTGAGLGIGGAGSPYFSGDGGPASAAELYLPSGLFRDDTGNLYVADRENNRIRKIKSGNHLPLFTGGHTQTLGMCVDSSKSINSLLSVTDADAGQTINWTVLSGPYHGTVSGTYATTSTGGALATTGLSYTPTAGYSGTDSFRVRVDDGTSLDITTIRVTIDPPAAAGLITGIDSVCPGDTVLLSGTMPGGTWASSSTALATVSSTGIVTGIATGTPTITYTVTNACNAAFATYPIKVRSAIGCPTSTWNITSQLSGVTVTPNPAKNGLITVNISTPHNDVAHIKVTDAMGRELIDTHAPTNIGNNIYVDAPGGLYFINVTTTTGRWAAKLVLIN